MKSISFLILSCGLLPAAAPIQPRPAPAPAGRTVQYSERDVVAVNAGLRYTTLIILPKEEQILDYVCGDKEFWVVNGSQNFAYIKPAKAGARSNLNLITAAGNVYSFLLQEAGEKEVDFKIFVLPRDETITSAIGKRRFYSAEEIEQYRIRAEAAEKQSRAVRDEAARQTDAAAAAAQSTIAKAKSELPGKLQFPYRWKPNEKPFLVSSIYTDGRFTYIKADPEETPVLYELKDGKPNLVNFEFRDGVYTVPKILDTGYLQIGKQKLNFYRKEN